MWWDPLGQRRVSCELQSMKSPLPSHFGWRGVWDTSMSLWKEFRAMRECWYDQMHWGLHAGQLKVCKGGWNCDWIWLNFGNEMVLPLLFCSLCCAIKSEPSFACGIQITVQECGLKYLSLLCPWHPSWCFSKRWSHVKIKFLFYTPTNSRRTMVKAIKSFWQKTKKHTKSTKQTKKKKKAIQKGHNFIELGDRYLSPWLKNSSPVPPFKTLSISSIWWLRNSMELRLLVIGLHLFINSSCRA